MLLFLCTLTYCLDKICAVLYCFLSRPFTRQHKEGYLHLAECYWTGCQTKRTAGGGPTKHATRQNAPPLFRGQGKCTMWVSFHVLSQDFLWIDSNDLAGLLWMVHFFKKEAYDILTFSCLIFTFCVHVFSVLVSVKGNVQESAKKGSSLQKVSRISDGTGDLQLSSIFGSG